jgi:hypothetical protein
VGKVRLLSASESVGKVRLLSASESVGKVTQVRLLAAAKSVGKARQLSALKIEFEMMQLARLLRPAGKRGIVRLLYAVRIDLVKLN